MSLTDKYIKMLSMNHEELKEYIISLSEKEVKEMLFLWISQDNKRRKDSTNL